MSKEYDVIVVGGGSGGLVAAVGSRSFGARVALIEKEKLGGDCLNTGCVPSKSLIKCAKIAHMTKNSSKFGIDAKLSKVDYAKVARKIADVVKEVGKHDDPKRFKKMGIDIIFGDPCFVSNEKIKVNGKILKAKKFVIATGSHPFVPPIKGIEKIDYLTNKNVFSMKELPEILGVIGAGPIGCELAQSFSRLGSKVIIFEGNERILAKEDEDVAKIMMKVFKKEGIKILTKTRVNAVKKKGKKTIMVAQNTNGKVSEIEVDKLLIATGRKPMVESLKLEKAGVDVTDRGAVAVNSKLQTSSPNIYACGDVVGSYQFTHIAEYHAKTVVWNMFSPVKKKVDYSVVPWTTYTDPEVATVGMNEQEAKEKCKGCKTYVLSGKDIDRFQTEGSSNGMVKLIITKDGTIKGSTILLPNAGEVIHEFVLAMQKKIKAQDISQMIHVYPTLAEGNKKVVNKFMVDKYLTPFAKKIAKFFFRYS